MSWVRFQPAVLACLLSAVAASSLADDGLLSIGPWSQSADGTVATSHEIRGAGTRRNPLRRELTEPFDGEVLYVRFRLRYASGGLDVPPGGDGEFFVLWLDAVEGGETSTHSGGIPNIGIHVKDGTSNQLMARFASGSANEVYAAPLEGDREYLLVGRLSRSDPEGRFDQLDLWVDPAEGDDAVAAKPTVSVSSARGGIDGVRWIGFSTGVKTEAEDRITVRDVALATSWAAILGGDAASIDEPGSTFTEVLAPEQIPDPPALERPPPPAEIAEVDPPPATMETDHWAFEPIVRPELPMPAAGDLGEDGELPPATAIDAFLAEAQHQAGVRPAGPADAATLRRRMALTITGLPPADDDAEFSPSTFDADRYADTLLASPQFGERWGRMWLDVARWAESNGHQHNRDRANAWQYRDWVVDAFNRDLPYDEFVRQQLAGDEIEPLAADQVVATGFLAAARYSGNELDKDIQRYDLLADVVNVTSKAFLGLTMECAQCHDHFFDPVSQWDYYRLMAFFAQGQPGDVILEESPRAAELVRQRWGLFESVRSRMIEDKRRAGHPEPILVIPKSVIGGMNAVEKRTFNALEKAIAEFPQAWAFYSPVTSPHRLEVAPNAIRWPLPFQRESLADQQVRFLHRGDVSSPGPVATAAWPQVFGEASGSEAQAIEQRPRLALADWLTDPAHPLTARVWVNRIWQGYFGRGLVETSGDFGVAGAEPDHPELLDWLASELIDSGWSSRHIHRLILRSDAFRRASQYSVSNAERDGDNVNLWRWQPRRLEAEAIRDSVLAVAGALDFEIGGPSIPREQQEATTRRALYLQQRRDNLPHQQTLFDAGNAVASCSHRTTSTVALQPLWMLNSGFMQTMSRQLATRVEAATNQDPVGRLIHLTWGREPAAGERERLQALVAESSLADAALVVLNANEFVYIP